MDRSVSTTLETDSREPLLGMTSTSEDPKDRGMMDVVGFDASAPAVIVDFVRN